MSRTAGLFCLRSNMPDLPDLDTDETAESNIPTSTPIRSDADAMTWQQQTDFGDLAVSKGSYPLPHKLSCSDTPPLCKPLARIKLASLPQPPRLSIPTTITLLSFQSPVPIKLHPHLGF
jgi:hypothetical protein